MKLIVFEWPSGSQVTQTRYFPGQRAEGGGEIAPIAGRKKPAYRGDALAGVERVQECE